MSYDIAVEDVPPFTKRVGDQVLQGSNNSLLYLGTDRPAGLDSGYGDLGSSTGGKEAGAAALVVGRVGRDFDQRRDSAFLYVSMKTDPDGNLGLEVEGATNGVSAAVLSADSVRLVCRRDLKVVVGDSYLVLKQDGTVVLEGSIKLGKEAQRSLVNDLFLTTSFPAHRHGGGTLPDGGTGPVLPPLPGSEVLTHRVVAE